MVDRDFAHVLAEIWQEVGRHIEINESVGRIGPVLARAIPLDLLLVRRFDPHRQMVETVAATAVGSASIPEHARSECRQKDLDRLLDWCRRGEPIRGTVKELRRDLPMLLPDLVKGEVIAGPLNAPDGPEGFLLLISSSEGGWEESHRQQARSLLEPFRAAFENDRRLRELSALREAVEADNRSLRSKLGQSELNEIVGVRSGLKPVMERVELVAGSDVPVLIFGETGSGKEVIARAVHMGSPRASGPFLRVNCGAIPPEMIDSELFGHEKGSFTGAMAQRKGWFERAHAGTLFLDECGELPLAAQVRLLRILQDGSFERVGGDQQVTVDVRIVAATHRDLHAMVSECRFREDLWYRLAVFPVRIPSLRERPEDIPAMAAHFAARSAKRFGMPILVPTDEDVRMLVAYPWPGNVRELKAVIERAAILGDGKRLEVAKALGTEPPRGANIKLSTDPVAEATEGPFPTLAEAMARHIEAALVRTRGRIEGKDGAGQLLGINPHTLRARMRKLAIDWDRFRRA